MTSDSQLRAPVACNTACIHSHWCESDTHCPRRHLQTIMLLLTGNFLQKRFFPKSRIAADRRTDPTGAFLSLCFIFLAMHINLKWWLVLSASWVVGQWRMSELSFAKRNLFILLDCCWVNVDNMSYSQCDRYFWGRDFVQWLLVKDLLVIGWSNWIVILTYCFADELWSLPSWHLRTAVSRVFPSYDLSSNYLAPNVSSYNK